MAGRLDLVDQCDREVRVRHPAGRVAMLSDPVPAGARAPMVEVARRGHVRPVQVTPPQLVEARRVAEGEGGYEPGCVFVIPGQTRGSWLFHGHS